MTNIDWQARVDQAEQAHDEARKERDRYYAAVCEAHAAFDAAEIPSAVGQACNDPNCNTHVGHRARVMVQQLTKAREEVARLRADDDMALREPPLWSIAIKECNDAHAALDRAKVPEQTEVPRRVGDGRHEITMGLEKRINWLRANRDELLSAFNRGEQFQRGPT